MKKFLTLTIIALIALVAITTNVQAADASTYTEIETALAGSDEVINVTAPITIDSEKTLDLKGKTLNLDETLVVENGGKLTVTGNGKITSSEADPVIKVNAGGTLIVENGTIESTTYWGATIQVYGSTVSDGTPKTTVTIKEDAVVSGNYAILLSQNTSKTAYGVVINVYGTLKGITGNNGYEEGSFAINVSGNILAPSSSDEVVPVINIYEGANLSAEEGTTGDVQDDDAPAIYGGGYAIWNISGGTITGSEALSIKSGVFNITGGTFKATGKYVYPPEAEPNGSEPTGSAISITKNTGYQGEIEINISNAVVESKNGYAISEATTKGTGTAVNSMKITSGEFTGNSEIGAVLVENIAEIGAFIEGGSYSSEIEEEYMDNTLTSVEEDGVYYVGTENKINVKEAKNGKVVASAEKAVKGQTITLTVTPDKDYEYTLKVYDADENEIKVTDNKFTMPDSEVTVEATFTEVENEEEEKDKTPETGGISMIIPVLSIVVIAVVALVATNKRK